MKKIRDNPAKAWELYREQMEDGSYVIQTGYYPEGRLGKEFGDSTEAKFYTYEYVDGKSTRRERKIDTVPNFIFEANIQYMDCQRGRSAAIFIFRDDDGIHKYETGMSGMDAILKEIASGLITLKEGKFSGTWTFKKQGSEIYLMPHNSKE